MSSGHFVPVGLIEYLMAGVRIELVQGPCGVGQSNVRAIIAGLFDLSFRSIIRVEAIPTAGFSRTTKKSNGQVIIPRQPGASAKCQSALIWTTQRENN
jgi:hypothetical protein